jgi:hypothetical protein
MNTIKHRRGGSTAARQGRRSKRNGRGLETRAQNGDPRNSLTHDIPQPEQAESAIRESRPHI